MDVAISGPVRAYQSAVYGERSDQWSGPLAERGFLFYAVVRDPATVIVLRLVSVG